MKSTEASTRILNNIMMEVGELNSFDFLNHALACLLLKKIDHVFGVGHVIKLLIFYICGLFRMLLINLNCRNAIVF